MASSLASLIEALGNAHSWALTFLKKSFLTCVNTAPCNFHG
jgi:hypothetical protein